MALALAFILTLAPLAYALDGDVAAQDGDGSVLSEAVADESVEDTASGEIKPLSTWQVGTPRELQTAINSSSPGDVIQFTNDIVIDGSPTTIAVWQSASLTFTGGYKLTTTGTSGQLLTVVGTLVIDGIDIISNVDNNGQASSGVVSVQGGHLTLKDGRVSASRNTNYDMAIIVLENGTFVMDGGTVSDSKVGVNNNGTFIMNGGVIESNSPEQGSNSGGSGVVNNGNFTMNDGENRNNNSVGTVFGFGGGGVLNTSTFIMNSGSIHDNNSNTDGGGISMHNFPGDTTSFTMNGGSIRNNTAADDGAGIYAGINASIRINSGELVNNSAEGEGGAIYAYDHNNLLVGSAGVFSRNTAGESDILFPDIDPEMAAIYDSNIQGSAWSGGAVYGYNDVDINYDYPEDTAINSVTINGSEAASTGAGNYPDGTTVTISAGTREGYTFTGWTIDSGSVTLANANAATTTFTMPASTVQISANWTEVSIRPSALPKTGDSTLYAIGFAALVMVVGMALLRQCSRRAYLHK